MSGSPDDAATGPVGLPQASLGYHPSVRSLPQALYRGDPARRAGRHSRSNASGSFGIAAVPSWHQTLRAHRIGPGVVRVLRGAHLLSASHYSLSRMNSESFGTPASAGPLSPPYKLSLRAFFNLLRPRQQRFALAPSRARDTVSRARSGDPESGCKPCPQAGTETVARNLVTTAGTQLQPQNLGGG